MLAFSRSFAAAVRQTGDADNLILVSKKAQSHVLSSIPKRECDLILNNYRDVAVAISREVYVGLNVEMPGVAALREGLKRAVLHGVDPPVGLAVNRLVRLKEGGRLPAAGKRELLCGETAAVRIGVPPEALRVGATLRFLDAEWTVVGHFAAPGTLMESELWAHVEDLRLHLKRRDYSFVRMKLKDPKKMPALADTITLDERFSVKAFP
jgi:putative ABC transport system permease protein